MKNPIIRSLKNYYNEPDFIRHCNDYVNSDFSHILIRILLIKI